MTTAELNEIEERWRFGTNTREDVRKLLDRVFELEAIADAVRCFYEFTEPIKIEFKKEGGQAHETFLP